jgi:hypothetical protein
MGFSGMISEVRDWVQMIEDVWLASLDSLNSLNLDYMLTLFE